MSGDAPTWVQRAAALVDEVLEHDDENGALANATGDELRDALRVAADRLRALSGRRPRGPLYVGARRLCAEVWQLARDGVISARSPAGDAALDLRDTIDTTWHPDPVDERPGWDRG